MEHSSRLIPVPLRAGSAGIAIISLSVLLLSFVSFLRAIPIAVFTAAIILVLCSWFSRDQHALHLAVFTAALTAVRSLLPSLPPWPYTLLIPLLASSGIGTIVPRMRRSYQWMRRGTLDRDMLISIFVIAVISGAALALWVVVLKPDLTVHLNNLPYMPLWLLPLAGLAFASANAATEEFIYRGMIMHALDSAAGAGVLSLLVQAWLFGAMHYFQGFPNGWWGVAMTFIYGVMLGWLRRRAQGLLAPWIAHMFADLVIFVIVAEIAVK
ncbi:MAG TPA: type II CAAX endopeptidase family protein [Nitrospirota bacterium]|nr:type II CAAX endopeptidase family protein [Nitrospirota bacterium]